MPVAIPTDEVTRLRTLADYRILDTAPEAAYDDLTHLAAYICGTPISLLTLVDSERQWFKSRVGLDVPETGREASFCAYAVADGAPFEVEDALADLRFAENPLVTGDPHIRFYAGAPLFTPEGHVLGTLCVIDREPRSLSAEQQSALACLARSVMAHLDLHRQNAQLRELDRMKEEFIAVVSHELRTPLASVVGYSEELIQETAGPLTETQRRFVGTIDRNAQRLLALVSDLLFLAQVEAGSAPVGRDLCDLAEVAREAAETARFAAAQKNINLRVELSSTGVPAAVRGDRVRLGQAADNLVSNAVKFTPEGGFVRVRVDRSAHELALTVEDTGIGIDPSELPHLFGRFYRTPAAANSAIPGSGLGLAITRAIVDAHGGVIDVESEEGTGTLFRIRIPLDAEAA